MKTLWTNRARRAVTLTELLVVLAIVSLLATLAVPVYVQQTERTRKAIARAEVRAIAEAEQMCAIAHGFYVPINILDNLPIDTSDAEPRDDMDINNNTFLNQMFVIDIAQRVVTQDGAQFDLNDLGETKIFNLVNNWEGPFLNPVRVTERFNPTANPLSVLDQDELALDIVLDPWGRPYQFYTSEGISSTAGNNIDLTTFDPTLQGDRIAADQLDINTDNDRFDRFAIVSFGPDGLADPDTGTGVFDDIYYLFGADPSPLTAP